MEYKKTRWNIDHRKLSYLHIPTSIWVPCAFRNVLSYGARFCVLQGKRNIHLICLGRRISPKMNVVGWEMIIMSEVRLYNGGGCSAEVHRRRKIICPRDRLVPQGSSFPLYVISHLSSNWKQQTWNNSLLQLADPIIVQVVHETLPRMKTIFVMWRCGSLNALLSELFHSTEALFSPEKPHLQWIELPPQMHLACCKYTFPPPANFLCWWKVFA